MIILLGGLATAGGDAFVRWARQFTESYARGKLHHVYFTPGVLLAALETPTRLPATHTNTYLVGDETVYIVDPAPVDPVEQEKLWNLLDEVIAEGRSLKEILLTHYQSRSCGGARGVSASIRTSDSRPS